MFQILIADDEPWIVSGLKNGISWEKLEVSEVFEAYNGFQAFDVIKNKNPAVVITDIQMPGMNGLELMKSSKRIHENIQFVILSGYAEFSYAQKAMRYGAHSYCLKPFELDEIQAALGSALKKYQEAAGTSKDGDAWLNDALDTGDEAALGELLGKSKLACLQDCPLVPVTTLGAPRANLPFPHLGLRNSLDSYTYLIQEGNLKDMLALGKTRDFAYGSIGVSSQASAIPALSQAMEESVLASYDLFIQSRPGIYHYKALPSSSSFREAWQGLAASMGGGDYPLLMEKMLLVAAEIKSRPSSMPYAYILWHIVSYLLPFPARDGQMVGDYQRLYQRFKTLPNMVDYLKGYAAQICQDQPCFSPPVEHDAIKEVLAYLNHHLTEDITIHELSKRFYLSGNYICSLFKKEVGKTLTEYVNHQRIQMACRLLSHTSLKIQEVGSQCGYGDYFYFAKTFKKMTGATPSNYRDQHVPIPKEQDLEHENT